MGKQTMTTEVVEIPSTVEPTEAEIPATGEGTLASDAPATEGDESGADSTLQE